MDWLIFIILFPIALSNAAGIYPDYIFDQIPSKEGFGMGPYPRKSEERLDLISPGLVKINFTDKIYLDTDPAIPPKWMSPEGAMYGFPFAMELGAYFRIDKLPFKVDLLGYYNSYVGYPGREYAWRAQLLFFLPD
jgi:hypothetical protein